jgi:RNA polymerase sigma factor (sigma-70 family)
MAAQVMQNDALSEAFEAERERLRGVAYRMLGSVAEAEDAVQETWLRLHSSEAGQIGNLGGWLTTVVSRISLDMLRSRKARREAQLVHEEIEPVLNREPRVDPEQEALLAEAVGISLMVVLNTLEPAERLAFVLHDLFGVPFDQIARIIDCSSAAARQLASRGRRRLRGADAKKTLGIPEQRRIVSAFFAASREGSFEKLLDVLAPGVELRADRQLLPPDAPPVIRGAPAVAKRALVGAARARYSRLLLVNGHVGIAVAPFGHLQLVLTFVVGGGRIQQINVVADRQRLTSLQLALIDE